MCVRGNVQLEYMWSVEDLDIGDMGSHGQGGVLQGGRTECVVKKANKNVEG